YRQPHFFPANTMLEGEVDRKHFLQTQQATIERLSNLGII
ncbi:MAG: nitrilase-related carbon-nitrogen hydrolase, partial [Nostoc sp.]